MKLEEILNRLLDPWDFVFASVGYVGGFVVGAVFSPGGFAAGETGGLSAVGALAIKKALWRAGAGWRARRRARVFGSLLMDGARQAPALHAELQRELLLHRSGVIDNEQLQVAVDAIVMKYRALDNGPEVVAPALPAAESPSHPRERVRELEPG